MADFMQDRGFLQELNKYRIKTYYAAIMILDFETEFPITRLEGMITGGTMSMAANSPTRRTGSLNVIFNKGTFNLTDLDNLISINKKIAISIGVNNPFYHQIGSIYREYGDIVWFKQGTFLITDASSSISATSCSINIKFIDKMGMLNGICGGTLPAAVSLHDRIEVDKDGNITTTFPRINQIIKEVVHHFGSEHFSRIIVDDVPDNGRQVVRWGGSSPIRFAPQTGVGGAVVSSFIISASANPNFPIVYYRGEDIGYMSTPLTYPGELVMKAGSTVTAILDEICKTLGNFEYFYDVDGIFHFQQIRNFDKTGATPVGNNINSSTPFNINPDIQVNSKFQNGYLPKYSNDQFLNEFGNSELVASISFSPKYSNIKNDFVVWGTRKTTNQEERMVRYHLAIDEKPTELDEVVIISAATDANGQPILNQQIVKGTLCRCWFWEVKENTSEKILGYICTNNATMPNIGSYGYSIDNAAANKVAEPLSVSLGNEYTFDWREELYRKALLGYNNAAGGTYYDAELLAEWRLIFNPMDEVFAGKWQEHYGNLVNWNGYNIDIIIAPEKIRYWLDFIDTSSPLGIYSISRIGRRSIVKENSKINEVMTKEIPDIVFIDDSDTTTVGRMQVKADMAYYISIGQQYCVVQPDFLPYFEFRNSFGTCYEEVRELVHLHLLYNAQVSMQTIPLFYLDVNKVIRINFPEVGVVGNFVISQLSWNLGGAPSMSISANEAVVIV